MAISVMDDLWNIRELDLKARELRDARDAAVEARSAGFEAKGGILVRTNGGATVRWTPAGAPAGARPSRFAPDLNEPRPGVSVPKVSSDGPATEKQVAFLTSLLDRKLGLSVENRAKIIAAGAASKQVASEMIDNLLQAPDRVIRPAQTFSPAGSPAAAPAFPDVPEGKYAVENGDGTLRFYGVDRPTEGKWAGFTFLAVWASDETFPIKNRETKTAILAEIACDPKAAMLRFGMEIGKCGHCGRTLTDASSRAAGIGPVCAAKAWA